MAEVEPDSRYRYNPSRSGLPALFLSEVTYFNGDGDSNITDAVASLSFLFGGGRAPALGEGCAELAGDCPGNCQ